MPHGRVCSHLLAGALLIAGPLLWGADLAAEPVPVTLEARDDGWQLLRGGEPYFIRGAGGSRSLEELVRAGGNSVRTWDAENVRGDSDVGVLLDEAQALGLTVTVGIWLGHERHGFDYEDPAQVAAQYERARRIVERYKDHPALLLWGIGNEMEGFAEGENPAVWSAVNDIAAMVKELDPHHPTMTVTAFVHGARIDFVHRRCPAIDIHGVNAYGGAAVVPEQLRAGGATKPYVLTEFGPPGPWEVPATSWGAPLEPTSTEKARFYRDSYARAVTAADGLALGAYAFLWGNKMEATPTWFGMFLEDGTPVAAIDAMTEAWSGQPPADLAPAVDPLRIDGDGVLQPGSEVEVRARARDPEGGPLTAHWSLREDSGETMTGGDFRPTPPLVDGAVLAGDVASARIRMPQEPGAYRLFYTVRDQAGKAGTANLPLLVPGTPRRRMPFPVYEDGFEGMPWAPSGWMGDIEKLGLDGRWAAGSHSGSHSIRIRYEGRAWAAIAWQSPPNNWGEQPGGYDLSGARALEFMARGEYGGERVAFGVGLIGADKPHPDSAVEALDGIVLGHEWQRFRIPLAGKDLSSIKTGFVVRIVGRQTPVTVYLDDIRYVN